MPKDNFALFSEGYSFGMTVLCAIHLAPYILNDQSLAGATECYHVRMSSKPCKVCKGEIHEPR